MKERRVTALVVAALVAGAGAALAGGGLRFEAEMSGAQEVPANASENGGDVRIHFRPDLSAADFVLTASSEAFADAVFGAHLHCNVAGQNGGIVVGFFGPGPFGGFDGKRLVGTITNANITDIGACGGGSPVNNIAALRAAMEQGRIYANFHTAAFPGGEVRGQLLEK
jgi:hypothetical protein